MNPFQVKKIAYFVAFVGFASIVVLVLAQQYRDQQLNAPNVVGVSSSSQTATEISPAKESMASRHNAKQQQQNEKNGGNGVDTWQPLTHEQKTAFVKAQWLQQKQEALEMINMGPSSKILDLNEFWLSLHPVAGCETLQRLGNRGDGGKFVCNLPRIVHEAKREGRRCVLYSFGSNYEIAFDKVMNSEPYGCITHSFDPTVDAQKQEALLSPGMHFHAIGLGPSRHDYSQKRSWYLDDAMKQPLMSLKDITEKVTKDTRVDILKIDIEWSEHTAIPYMFEKELDTLRALGVKTIQLELHVHEDKRRTIDHFKDEIFKIISLFEDNGYYMYVQEPNVPFAQIAWEFAFVHESIL